MKRIALSLVALMLLGSGVSLAQDKGNVNLRRDTQPGALSDTPITPEMWLYEQERDRYADVPTEGNRHRMKFAKCHPVPVNLDGRQRLRNASMDRKGCAQGDE